MREKDELVLLINVLKKREQILINNKSVKKYNQNFERMRTYAKNLIDNNRQEELLPYVDCDSVSI